VERGAVDAHELRKLAVDPENIAERKLALVKVVCWKSTPLENLADSKSTPPVLNCAWSNLVSPENVAERKSALLSKQALPKLASENAAERKSTGHGNRKLARLTRRSKRV
jgi:hypothetical protein